MNNKTKGIFNDNQTFIIAEAGVNHDGDVNKAYTLIEKAYDTGASVVKFQSFLADDLVLVDAENHVSTNICRRTCSMKC